MEVDNPYQSPKIDKPDEQPPDSGQLSQTASIPGSLLIASLLSAGVALVSFVDLPNLCLLVTLPSTLIAGVIFWRNPNAWRIAVANAILVLILSVTLLFLGILDQGPIRLFWHLAPIALLLVILILLFEARSRRYYFH